MNNLGEAEDRNYELVVAFFNVRRASGPVPEYIAKFETAYSEMSKEGHCTMSAATQAILLLNFAGLNDNDNVYIRANCGSPIEYSKVKTTMLRLQRPQGRQGALAAIGSAEDGQDYEDDQQEVDLPEDIGVWDAQGNPVCKTDMMAYLSGTGSKSTFRRGAPDEALSVRRRESLFSRAAC